MNKMFAMVSDMTRNICLIILFAFSAAYVQANPQETVTEHKPILELQVFATKLVIRENPDPASSIIAQVQRGDLLSVYEQRGDWFKVAISSSVQGWVHKEPGEYGQMSVGVFFAKNPVQFASDDVLEKTPNEGQQIAQNRPGHVPDVVTLPPIDPEQVEPPQPNLPRESISVPDRWRIMEAIGFKFPFTDPYNPNPFKGDLPVLKNWGDDIFFSLGIISDTLVEARRLPTPVPSQIATKPGENDVFGRNQQNVLLQNLILSFELSKGDTTFKPSEYKFRFVPVFNYNRVSVGEAGALNIDPSTGTGRTDNFVAIQELFIEKHLRNVSDRYDFDSLTVGIQPFTNDFRGFLFQDSALGIRLFGNRHNNQYQYNLAWFRRLEKDTNSGLNDVGRPLRNDDVFVANLYRQDFPVHGFTTQLSAVHNRNNDRRFHYDTNGVLVRPALVGDVRPNSYQVTYLGINTDGHIGPWNLTSSVYGVFGTDDHNPIAHRGQKIRAGFFASELSRDFNWMRVRGNFLVASGDKDPFDDTATGFDAIVENPDFAGADTNFFIRQAIPLIGGGLVSLAGRNSVLPSLRSSKDQGQSNFVNPGIGLIGIGADFDVTPQLRVFTNASYLRFMNTSSLALLRNQAIPSSSIGTDLSVGFHLRPYFTQNIIVNGSVAVLNPGEGLKQLYGDDQGTFYSAVLNVVLTF
jgi:hypothetical protein